jgi:hypothetical protein
MYVVWLAVYLVPPVRQLCLVCVFEAAVLRLSDVQCVTGHATLVNECTWFKDSSSWWLQAIVCCQQRSLCVCQELQKVMSAMSNAVI